MKTNFEIFNTLRAFLLIAIFATFTVFCIIEMESEPPIKASEPAEGVGRYTPPETQEETYVTEIEEILRPVQVPATTSSEPAETEESIRYPLTAEERYKIEAVVYSEAWGEDFDGQCLVAQCILNTAEALGVRPEKVIYADGQYAEPNYDEHHHVSEAVSAVFDHGYQVTEEPIRYFYAPARCTSEWHESLEFVLEHGGHKFFKLP